MAKEQRSIVLNGVTVDYILEYKSVKRINITLHEEDGTIYISLPRTQTIDKVEEVLYAHQDRVLDFVEKTKQKTSKKPLINAGEIKKDSRTIPYQITRKKMKTMRLHFDSTFMGFQVHIPSTCSVEYVEKVILDDFERLYGILETAMQNAKQNANQYPVTYTSGETVLYLGERYTLEVQRSTKSEVICKNQKIYLLVKNPNNELERRKTFEQWWVNAANHKIQETCRRIYPHFQALGIPYPTVVCKPFLSKWGTCYWRERKITFNIRLLAAPQICMDYVVIHEFCHFLHHDHSKAFWAEVAKLMPNYKEIRDMLNKQIETRV